MPRHVWGVSRASKVQARSARGAFDPRESKSILDFSPHPAWLPERTARTVTQADLAHDYCCCRASRFAGSFSGRQPRHGIAINYSSVQFINTYVSLCLVWMSAGGNQRGRQVPSHSLELYTPMRNPPQKIISWDLHLSESDRGRSGLYFFSAHSGVGFPYEMCNIEGDFIVRSPPALSHATAAGGRHFHYWMNPVTRLSF